MRYFPAYLGINDVERHPASVTEQALPSFCPNAVGEPDHLIRVSVRWVGIEVRWLHGNVRCSQAKKGRLVVLSVVGLCECVREGPLRPLDGSGVLASPGTMCGHEMSGLPRWRSRDLFQTRVAVLGQLCKVRKAVRFVYRTKVLDRARVELES